MKLGLESKTCEAHRIALTPAQKKYLKVKRVMDVLLSGLALCLLAFPFLLIAVLQKISSPTEPVFFRQRRVGQNGHAFYITKFRTMKSTAPKYLPTGSLQDSDSYISKLGRFLRDTSIDELPQLFNVLTGDMSLVGPRPLIRQERSIHFLRRYYGVDQLKPGITGLAQINGRDLLTDYDKVFYDREYLRNVSMALDIKVLLGSIPKVLGRQDIQEGTNPLTYSDDELSPDTQNNGELTEFQEEVRMLCQRRAM